MEMFASVLNAPFKSVVPEDFMGSQLLPPFTHRQASSGESSQVQEMRSQLRRRDDRIDALQQELKVLRMEQVTLTALLAVILLLDEMSAFGLCVRFRPCFHYYLCSIYVDSKDSK